LIYGYFTFFWQGSWGVYLILLPPIIIINVNHAIIMKNKDDLQLALQLGFGVVKTVCNALQINVFLQAWMLSDKLNCNGYNSPYVKLYTYATHEIQL